MSPKRLPACMDEAAQFSRHSPTSGSPDRTQKPWVPDRVRIDCITDPCAPINRSGWLRAGLKAAIWLSALMTVGYGLLVGGMTQAAGLLAISEGRLPPPATPGTTRKSGHRGREEEMGCGHAPAFKPQRNAPAFSLGNSGSPPPSISIEIINTMHSSTLLIDTHPGGR